MLDVYIDVLCRRSWFKSLSKGGGGGYKVCIGDCTLSNNCFTTHCAHVYSVVLYSVRYNTDDRESNVIIWIICCTTECPNNPCMNGATCHDDLRNQSYKCDCPPPFTGGHCETGVYSRNVFTVVEQTRCSAIAERPRYRVRYSFRQK